MTRPGMPQTGPVGAFSPRASVIVGLALASVATVGFLAFAPPPSSQTPLQRSDAPVIKAPSQPFKTAYAGPQTAPEAPAPREIYDAMAGQARAPGTAPVDVDKTAAAKSVAPEAPPAPAKEPTKALPKTPAEKAEPKAPEPKKAEPKTPLPSRFTANGAFLAQLGAFSSPAGARDAANALRARAASAVAGAAFDVQRAELDDGIVVHRLRVGGFADRPAVERFCQEMRAMGQGCMAVSR